LKKLVLARIVRGDTYAENCTDTMICCPIFLSCILY
jgi:hypothetical protein